MKETIKSIIEWHEQTFPDATLEGQTQKYIDEKKEYQAATTVAEKNEELADVFIVGCGIARFDIMFAMAIFSYVNQEFAKLYGITGKDTTLLMTSKVIFENVVSMKMEKNRQRKWSIGKGTYQHIEENK